MDLQWYGAMVFHCDPMPQSPLNIFALSHVFVSLEFGDDIVTKEYVESKGGWKHCGVFKLLQCL